MSVGIPAFLQLVKDNKKLDSKHAGEVLHYSVWRGSILIRSGRLVVPQNLENILIINEMETTNMANNQ